MSEPLRKPDAQEAPSSSAIRPRLTSEMRVRPPLPPSSSQRQAPRPAKQELERCVLPPVVREVPRQALPPAIPKSKAQPPPLPSVAQPSGAKPPPLPTAPLPVPGPVARPTWTETRSAEDVPDFPDGAARRRRVVRTVLAVAVMALLAAFGATIASHLRPL